MVKARKLAMGLPDNADRKRMIENIDKLAEAVAALHKSKPKGLKVDIEMQPKPRKRRWWIF